MVAVLALALVVPMALVAWRYRGSWVTVGIVTLYYAAVSAAVGAAVDSELLTEPESEVLFLTAGPAWLAVVVAVSANRIRARRRLQQIQRFLDANPAPDTIPEWVTASTPVAPRRLHGKVFRLRYPATCGSCGAHLPARAEARWDKARKVATCVVCVDGTASAPDPGVAGASARRVANRRARRGQVSASRWEKGADGEERVGQWLDALHERGCYVLHDRRLPGSMANIDHLVVSPAGVWVIDAKNYTGHPTFEGEDGRGGAAALRIDGYSKRDLIEGVHRQVEVVRQAVGNALDAPGADVRGLLCFVGPTSELLIRPLAVDDVGVAWPGVVLALLKRTPGPFTDEEMRGIAARLANGLPEATGRRSQSQGRRRATAGLT
jgi:hypothetical protein